MRRSLKKLVVLVTAMVMMFAMSITAFASGTNTVKSIKIVNDSNKQVKTATLYVNGEDDSVKEVYHDGTQVKMPETMTYSLDIKGKSGNTDILKNLTVTVKDRAVATATVADDKLTVKAKGSGKTTITVSDRQTGKKASLTVTVKKIADDVNFAVATETDDLSGKEVVHIEQKGKVNLLASANGDSKTVKYVVKDQKVLVDGKWVDSVNAKKKTVAVVKVDKKGVVTANAEKRSNVELAKATVVAYAADQKVTNPGSKGKTVTTTTGVYEEIEVYVYPATYAKTDIIRITNLGKETNKKLGKTNKYAAQTLYTNEADAAHTLTLVASAYTKGQNGYVADSSKKVTYTTSNAKVATVSADGVVTAVGNGSATISVVPAYGASSPKATVKVTVKTKVEGIKVAETNLEVAIGKTVKAGATLDKNVSTKGLTYVSSDTDIATVNAKGVIKGKAEGMAVITVTAKDNAAITKDIYVNVYNPVNKVTIKDEDGNAFAKNKTTIYAYDESKVTVDAEKYPQSVDVKVLGTAKKGTATYGTEINVESAKDSIAEVTDFTFGEDATYATITANAKGSVKVKATAIDGSKKSATLTVNVVKFVDDITVSNAYWNGNEYVLNVVAGKKTKISAAGDAGATKKSVTISGAPEGVTLDNKGNINVPAGAADFDLTLTAVDDGKYTQTLKIHVVDEDTYGKEDTVAISMEGYTPFGAVADDMNNVTKVVMKKDSNVTLKVVFDDMDVTNRSVTWKANNKNVTVKNGVITGKKVGDSTVTMTYVAGNKTKATKTVAISVAQSDADFRKAINKKISANLRAEDRSYLGITLPNKLSDKADELDIMITNPDIVIAEQEETGLMAVIDSMVEPTTNYVNVMIGDVEYVATRDVSSLTAPVIVKKNGVEIASVNDYTAVGDILADELEASGYITLGDMDGLYVYVDVENAIGKSFDGYDGVIKNSADYHVFFAMPSVDMDAAMDAKIAEEMAALKANGTLDNAGVESVIYNAATNNAVVTIKDGKKTMAEVDATRTEVAASMKAIFEDAWYAEVAVEAGDIDRTEYFVDFEKEDIDASINKLLDKVLENVGKDTEIGVFEGGKATAEIVFENGCVFEYTLNFARTTSSVDAQVDDKIAAEMSAVDNAGFAPAYDAEANTLTVKVTNTGYSVAELQGAGFITAIKNVLTDVAKANAAVTATVWTDGVATELDDLANVTATEIEEAFGVEEAVYLGDLLNKSAVVEVVYPQISGDVTLTYNVNYTLNLEAIGDSVDAVIEKAIADAKAKDAVLAADTAYADGTVNVVIDANNDKAIADADAIYDIFKAAIPNGDIKATSITVANIETGYQKTFGADVSKETIGNFVMDATEVADDANVSALEGNTLKLKVVYSQGDAEVAIVYTVNFSVVNKAAEDSGAEAAPASEEEVEAVNEATEEVSEETTEEAAEEVVETEEATEEVTEEVAE